jgi:hypothetical protein
VTSILFRVCLLLIIPSNSISLKKCRSIISIMIKCLFHACHRHDNGYNWWVSCQPITIFLRLCMIWRNYGFRWPDTNCRSSSLISSVFSSHMALSGSGTYPNRCVFSIYLFSSFENLVKSLTAADKLRDLLSQLDHGSSPSSPPIHHSNSPKVYTQIINTSLSISIS